jgi:hypothetical protein
MNHELSELNGNADSKIYKEDKNSQARTWDVDGREENT